jgi:gas vesicle protein
MAKTRDKVYDTAENIKPYVERAMTDDKLRSDVMKAFQTAKELYGELVGGDHGAVTLATRVATDDDIRDKVRDALEDLRQASDRLQGKRSHSGRNTTILIAGLALGILYNPVSGRETRRFIKDMISGSSESPSDFSSGNGHS